MELEEGAQKKGRAPVQQISEIGRYQAASLEAFSGNFSRCQSEAQGWVVLVSPAGSLMRCPSTISYSINSHIAHRLQGSFRFCKRKRNLTRNQNNNQRPLLAFLSFGQATTKDISGFQTRIKVLISKLLDQFLSPSSSHCTSYYLKLAYHP